VELRIRPDGKCKLCAYEHRREFGGNRYGHGQLRLNATPRTVSGDLIIDGGYFVVGSGASRTLNVLGNVFVTAGTLDLSRSAGATGTLNVHKDFSATGGTITETNTGSGSIVFNGGITQTYSSGSLVSNTINFTVSNGTTLQMADQSTVVSGGGTFLLSAGATLGINATAGITTAGFASGNIQTTARNYTAARTIFITELPDQSAGNGLTQFTPANVTILNLGNTVSLSAPTTISGTLTIASGTLDANGQNCSVGGNWTNSGGTFAPGSNTVTFTKAAGTQTLNPEDRHLII